RMGAYFLCVPGGMYREAWGDAATVREDEEGDHTVGEARSSLDLQARTILAQDPGAHFIVRFSLQEPGEWRKAHPDQLVVNENAQTLNVPSLASEAFWAAAARYGAAMVRYCERQAWGGRVLGYADFQRDEGTHDPLTEYWLYDHSAAMTTAWRSYLKS